MWGWRKVIVNQRVCWGKDPLFSIVMRLINIIAWVNWKSFLTATFSHDVLKILLGSCLNVYVRYIDIFLCRILIKRRKCTCLLSLIYFWFQILAFEISFALIWGHFLHKLVQWVLRFLLSRVKPISGKRFGHNLTLSLMQTRVRLNISSDWDTQAPSWHA